MKKENITLKTLYCVILYNVNCATNLFFTDFPYNKSASLPGYGRNGIFKVNVSKNTVYVKMHYCMFRQKLCELNQDNYRKTLYKLQTLHLFVIFRTACFLERMWAVVTCCHSTSNILHIMVVWSHTWIMTHSTSQWVGCVEAVCACVPACFK